MLLAALACRPPPLPPPAAPPAVAYTTGAPDPDDPDGALTRRLAAAVGARPDDGAVRMAQALLARRFGAGSFPELRELDPLALQSGMPLPLVRFATVEEDRRWFEPALTEQARPDADAGPVALGAAAARMSRRTWLGVVVLAGDGFGLEAPVPRTPDGPTDLRIRWTGEGFPRVLSHGPDGLVATDLVLADGLASGRIPGPGVRHDLVRVREVAGIENSDLVGSFDQPTAAGALPAAPPLVDGADPVARVVASLDALRVGRGHPPLERIDMGRACEDWPDAFGDAWVSDQQCWETEGGAWGDAWSDSAARPAFLEAVSGGTMDLVDVELGDGLRIHLLDRFERVDAAVAADRVAALLAARWGASRFPSDAAFLQDRVRAFAGVSEVRQDAVLQEVVDRDLPLPDAVEEVVVLGLTAATLEALVEQADAGFVPRLFAVACADALGETGGPAHYALVVAAR